MYVCMCVCTCTHKQDIKVKVNRLIKLKASMPVLQDTVDKKKKRKKRNKCKSQFKTKGDVRHSMKPKKESRQNGQTDQRLTERKRRGASIIETENQRQRY